MESDYVVARVPSTIGFYAAKIALKIKAFACRSRELVHGMVIGITVSKVRL